MAAPAGGAVGPVDPDAWLKDGRFVDTNGKPLLGSEWAASTSPEYNQMAFKLTIVADEQRWQKLLLEFCNSPLPLEIREVRINPSDREEGAEDAGSRPGPRKAAERVTDSVLHNVTLEIDGVAYLMNPPNLAKLGIKAADAAPVAAVPPPATTPPAATPPAATPAPAPATTPPAGRPRDDCTGNYAHRRQHHRRQHRHRRQLRRHQPPTPPPTTTPATTPPTTAPPATVPPATTPPATVPPPVAAPPRRRPANND